MGSSPISSNVRSVAAAPPHVLLSTKCLSYLEALAPPGAAQCVGAAARARAKPCSHAPAVPGPSAARACVCVCVCACVRAYVRVGMPLRWCGRAICARPVIVCRQARMGGGMPA